MVHDGILYYIISYYYIIFVASRPVNNSVCEELSDSDEEVNSLYNLYYNYDINYIYFI